MNGFETARRFLIRKWVVLSVNLRVGLLTSPVGDVVCIAGNRPGMLVVGGFRETVPFIIPLVAILILITYIPSLALRHPRLCLA